MLTIKELRENKRLSQTDFANIMGVSLRTIQNWEANQDKIPLDKLVNIYKELDNELPEIKSHIHRLEQSVKPIVIENKGVPYYDIDFTAGFLEVENNNQIKPDSYINHPFFKGCDYVVRASGQSMAKVIAHGDAIGLIKIDNWRVFMLLEKKIE